MRQLFAVLITTVALGMPLVAGSFKTSVTGYIRNNRAAGLEMAIAAANADPLWGYNDEASFEAYKKQAGPLPNVTVTGSGYTNSQGKFLFNVTVSWDDAGVMPTKTYRSKEGKDVEYVSVAVIYKATATGYASSTQKGRLNEGFEGQVNFSMAEATVLKGGIVLAEGRRFLPDFKLALTRRSYDSNRNLVEDVRFEFSTDKNGFFEATGEDMPTGSLSLRILSDEYAFEPGSAGWRNVMIRGGTLDLGILAVVPGGGIKLSAVDSETGKPVAPFYGTLKSAEQGRHFQFHLDSDVNANVVQHGIPVGKYAATFVMKEHWAPEVSEFEITPGQTLDLGTLKCNPERILDVLAFGPDGGLPNYQVNMVYLGNNAPPARRPFRETDLIRAGGQLTAENTKIRGLFDGEWQVSIIVSGYADHVSTVTLPMSGPLKVTLEAAGTIEYKLLDGNGRQLSGRWAFALRHGSPGYTEMATLDMEGLQKYTNNGVLPEGAYRKSYRGNKFEGVSAGTYLLLADGGWNLVLTADDITLKTGETVSATLLPLPGKLTIKVTDGGKPKANYNFFLRFEGDRQPQVKLTSDKNGVAVHETTLTAAAWVLTENENEYVTASDERERWRVLSDSVFPERRAQVQVARETEFKFEIANPSQVFLRVVATLEEGQSITRMSLTRTDGERVSNRNNFNGVKLGNDFCFVCVPQGKYTIGASVQSSGAANYFNADVVVDKLREQTLKVKVELFRLDVTLKPDAGFDIANIRVYLALAEGEKYWPRSEPTMLQPDADGRITFDCLSPGSYHLFVRVYDDGNVLQHALRKDVQVKGNASLNVPVSDKVGTLSVQIEGEPLRTARAGGGSPMVYILDAKGELVPPGDPSLLDEVYSYFFSVPGVPTGTYTVIVAASGFQAFEIKDVKIEKGKTTSVKATPEKAGALILNTSNLPFHMETKINFSYEDANGKALSLWLPNGGVSNAVMGDHKGNGGTITLTCLTPAVKQVRISVEGHKDIVVKIDVKPGEVITKDVKGEKK